VSAFDLLRKPKSVDELQLNQLKERGARAEALGRDETLSEAFVRVEEIYMRAWRNSDPMDIDTRERAWVSVQLLGDVRAQLLQFVAQGEAATKQLIKEAERGKKRAA